MRLTLFLCMALAAGSVLAADARSSIEARNKALSAAVTSGNAAAIGSFYTADAQALPPNHDIVSGRDAIQAFWQGTLDSGVKGLTLTTTEVDAHGDLAHEVGRYVVFVDGGKTADTGKYIVIWKRAKGEWFLNRDIWNSSMAPPTTAAAAAPANADAEMPPAAPAASNQSQ